jgi:hypothetical protein
MCQSRPSCYCQYNQGSEGIGMYRQHTLPVQKVVHEVYSRVPPLWATQNTAHEQVCAHIHVKHTFIHPDATDSTPFQRSASDGQRTQQRPRYERKTSAEASGRQQVRTDAVNCKVLLLTLSVSTGSNSCSNPPAKMPGNCQRIITGWCTRCGCCQR